MDRETILLEQCHTVAGPRILPVWWMRKGNTNIRETDVELSLHEYVFVTYVTFKIQVQRHV